MKDTMTGLVITFIALISASALAQQSVYQSERRVNNVQKAGDVGIGIQGGLPSAINMKFWIEEDRAFNANIGYSSGDLALMGDYLWHFRSAFSASERKPAVLSPYIGLGAVFVFDTDGTTTGDRPLYRKTDGNQGVGIGARVPIGVEFLPEDFPAGIYAEIAPGGFIAPDTFAFLQAAIGARYYF